MRNKNNFGFTLIELIVTLLIVSILSIAAISRFFNRNAFDARGFSDRSMAVVRHAQKIAVTHRRTVCLTFTSTSLSLVVSPTERTVDCTAAPTALVSPTGTTPYVVNAPVGVTYAVFPGTMQFDALGRAMLGGVVTAQTIQVTGTAGFTVEGETGYVHP
ncbi:hypothetical protein BH11PSE11_BH11PSE11_11400 [soil metagenome]